MQSEYIELLQSGERQPKRKMGKRRAKIYERGWLNDPYMYGKSTEPH